MFKEVLISDCYYENGLKFECQQCSACCRFDPGFVYVSHNEIKLIANDMKIEINQFINKYCKRVFAFNELKYSLIEKKNFDCIFWEKESGGCKIYQTRPVQCRTYPFWPSLLASKERWDQCGEGCPGINKGSLHSMTEIEKAKSEYKRAVYGIKS